MTTSNSPSSARARGVQQAPLPIKIGYQAVASWLLFGARSLKLYEKAGLAPTFVKFTERYFATPASTADGQTAHKGDEH